MGLDGYSLIGLKLNNTLITGPVIYKSGSGPNIFESNSNNFIENEAAQLQVNLIHLQTILMKFVEDQVDSLL